MRRHLSLLCSGLHDRGIGVKIAAPPGFTFDYLAADAAPITSIPLTTRAHPLNDLRAALAVCRAAREIDLIHGHGLRGAWIAALASRWVRKPFVFTAHNLAPAAGGLSRAALRFAVGCASAVICISQAVADSLRPYGIRAAQAVLIPNGIDLGPYDAPHPSQATPDLPPSRPRERLIVSIGRLSPEKGFDVLVGAAQIVLREHADARFVLAGDGPERERLAALARQVGLGERFTIAGHVADAPALLLAADIVVVPSRLEGQGLVALEAMAARKPVVASRVGGLVETVVDGQTGLVIPPEDPAALASAICRLLDDEPSRKRMGEAGRARVEQLYPLDRMVDQTIELYRRVVSPTHHG